APAGTWAHRRSRRADGGGTPATLAPSSLIRSRPISSPAGPGHHRRRRPEETAMSIPTYRTAPAANPRRVAHLLDSRLHGRLHLPGDAGYDPGGHGTPDVVVDAATAADVRATVRAARESGLPLTVLATGHGTVTEPDGGILLRTSRMAQVLVDPDHRIARVGPGARWGEVVAAAEPFGLAPLSGDTPSVGVVGYTLG